MYSLYVVVVSLFCFFLPSFPIYAFFLPQDFDTLQRVNYVHEKEPAEYARAWAVPEAQLCPKECSSQPPRFDTARRFPCALVFVPEPNASKPGAAPERDRTRSRACAGNTTGYGYHKHFKPCVTAAVRAGLDAMIGCDVEVALLPRLSAGALAGKWEGSLAREYVRIVDAVLAEPVTCADGTTGPRGAHFAEVWVLTPPGDAALNDGPPVAGAEGTSAAAVDGAAMDVDDDTPPQAPELSPPAAAAPQGQRPVGFNRRGGATSYVSAAAQPLCLVPQYSFAQPWLPLLTQPDAPLHTTSAMARFISSVHDATEQHHERYEPQEQLAALFPAPRPGTDDPDYAARFAPGLDGDPAEWYAALMEQVRREVASLDTGDPAAVGLRAAFGAFEGESGTTSRCANCSVEADSGGRRFWTWSLPPPQGVGGGSVQQLMQRADAWGPPPPSCAWSCGSCGAKEREVRRGAIQVMPQVLVVRLRRRNGGPLGGQHVIVDEQLDLQSPTGAAGRKTLQAVLCYTPSRRSFVVYARDATAPDRWWVLDGTHVRQVSAAEAADVTTVDAVLAFYASTCDVGEALALLQQLQAGNPPPAVPPESMDVDRDRERGTPPSAVPPARVVESMDVDRDPPLAAAPRQPVGLENLGGTCFKNAPAQVMCLVPQYDFAAQWLPYVAGTPALPAPTMTTTRELVQFVDAVRAATAGGTRQIYSPHELGRLLPPPAEDEEEKYPLWYIGDAAEWYEDVLEQISVEMERWAPEKFPGDAVAMGLTTAFDAAFRGVISEQRRCAACHDVTPGGLQQFWTYPVPLPAAARPLQACLRDLNSWDDLNSRPDPDDKWACAQPGCTSRQREVRDDTVLQMPQVFVVQFRRASLGPADFNKVKVDLAEDLDVRPLLTRPQRHPDMKTLQAVVCHCHPDLHFVTYARDASAPGVWWLFNDSTVKRVTFDTVMRKARTHAVLAFYTSGGDPAATIVQHRPPRLETAPAVAAGSSGTPPLAPAHVSPAAGGPTSGSTVTPVGPTDWMSTAPPPLQPAAPAIAVGPPARFCTHYDYKDPLNRSSLSAPGWPPFVECAQAATVVNAGGSQSVGWDVVRAAAGDGSTDGWARIWAAARMQGRLATEPKVGIMVAGNSGRPGGAVGLPGGRVDHAAVHAGHTTQEEDVVACWLVAQAGTDHDQQDVVFQCSIDRMWGMRDPESDRLDTIQGVNYVDASRASQYADAWVVQDQWLCTRTADAHRRSRQFNLASAGRAEVFRATLVFVSGPNRNAVGPRPSSTTTRTLNTEARCSYDFFRDGVRAAVTAGLDAMIEAGVTVALVARVSCGLYAGNWCENPTCCPPPPLIAPCRHDPGCTARACPYYHRRTPCQAIRLHGVCLAQPCLYAHAPEHCPSGRGCAQRIQAEYRTIVNDVLREHVYADDGTEHQRGCYFELVLIPLLEP